MIGLHAVSLVAWVKGHVTVKSGPNQRMVVNYAEVKKKKLSHAMISLAAHKRIVPSSLGKSGKVAMPRIPSK
jgi:uncharacterized Rossmann fold enzyme